MRPQNYQLRAGTISCPGCGTSGLIKWEDVPLTQGSRQELVQIEGKFSERISKKPPHPVELVCISCGAAQPAPLQV